MVNVNKQRVVVNIYRILEQNKTNSLLLFVFVCALDAAIKLHEMNDVIDECIADYDYTAEAALELSFKKGDVLLIYEKNARSGWWDGSRPDGRRGFVPSNYRTLPAVVSCSLSISFIIMLR